MKSLFVSFLRNAVLVMLPFVATSYSLCAGPTPAAKAAFDNYASQVEARLSHQHQSTASFVTELPTNSQLKNGSPIIERLTPPGIHSDGALIHHWRGTAFAPGAKATDFERLMRDISSYPQHFSPQVLKANLISSDGDHLQASMRVRQRHVITVVLDTTYNITFATLDPQHGYSISRSTNISEIDSASTSSERILKPSEEHGFLWRLNTYWTYEERDGGLYLQIESISLTRSIPTGLAWAIRPYIESIPRESLEFTLTSVCNALRK